MRQITHLSVHTSDSTFGTVNSVRAWHLERKFSDVGYHFIVKNGRFIVDSKYLYLESLDGHIDVGRPLEKTPASVYRYNNAQIAVCIIGKNGKYSTKQIESIVRLIGDLCIQYDIAIEKVLGHNEYPKVSKTCPNLNMDILRDSISLYISTIGTVNDDKGKSR